MKTKTEKKWIKDNAEYFINSNTQKYLDRIYWKEEYGFAVHLESTRIAWLDFSEFDGESNIQYVKQKDDDTNRR